MNKLSNKRMIKVLVMLIFGLMPSSGFGQFNTIRYKKDVPKVEIFTPQTVYANTTEVISEKTIKELVEDEKVSASLPLNIPLVNSRYGNRKDPINRKDKFHYGMDFQAKKDSVLSILPGIVKRVGSDKKLGNFVEVEHGDFSSIYGHLSKVGVEHGQTLTAGDFLGITGNTGRSTGEHLHFAMKYLNQWIDPEPILDYIFEIIEYVKGDFSRDVDSAIRNK